jgi:hypothetical protein
VAHSPPAPNVPPSSIAVVGGTFDTVGDSAGASEIAGEEARELGEKEAVGAIGGESEGAVGPRCPTTMSTPPATTAIAMSVAVSGLPAADRHPIVDRVTRTTRRSSPRPT